MDMSEIEKLERAKVGTIKLSEAMRIGAKLLPQGRGRYFSEGKTCAIGAAFHAIHGYPDASMQIADWLEGQGY